MLWTAEFSTAPHLRLHRAPSDWPMQQSFQPAPAQPTVIPAAPGAEHFQLKADDPRWILALETRAKLQGALLSPADRQRLLEEGLQLGLTVFDANLILAIIQDQARRGFPVERSCSLLALIRKPARWTPRHAQLLRVLAWAAAALLIQIILIAALAH